MDAPIPGQPPVPEPLMFCRPGPLGFWAKRMPDGNVLVHIEHSTGSTSLPVTSDFAKAMIAQLQEVTGGIVVPTAKVN